MEFNNSSNQYELKDEDLKFNYSNKDSNQNKIFEIDSFENKNNYIIDNYIRFSIKYKDEENKVVSIFKRYSDFENFYYKLLDNILIILPYLSKKDFINKLNPNIEFIKNRQKELELFLNKISTNEKIKNTIYFKQFINPNFIEKNQNIFDKSKNYSLDVFNLIKNKINTTLQRENYNLYELNNILNEYKYESFGMDLDLLEKKLKRINELKLNLKEKINKINIIKNAMNNNYTHCTDISNNFENFKNDINKYNIDKLQNIFIESSNINFIIKQKISNNIINLNLILKDLNSIEFQIKYYFKKKKELELKISILNSEDSYKKFLEIEKDLITIIIYKPKYLSNTIPIFEKTIKEEIEIKLNNFDNIMKDYNIIEEKNWKNEFEEENI